MLNLNYLINKYGAPTILIDNYKSKIGYAILGIKDKIECNNFDSKSTQPLNELNNKFNEWITRSSNIAAIGYINYDIKNIIYPHIQFKEINDSTPLFWFISPKEVIPYEIFHNEDSTNSTNNIDLIKDILAKDEYSEIINQIKRELKAGNVYQINMTMYKKYKINIDPLKLYLALRQIAKPHFGYYINTGEQFILSFSPEQFFNVNNRTITTYPMKGTQKRSNNPIKDLEFKKNLQNSEKDLAEHLMIVDLMRNDIGKICKYGSVKVENLFEVQSFPTVHQMVSSIYGELKKDVNYADIIQAIFPGGSITGAPKESAMKIIDKLENYNRGLYTGSIGYIDNQGDMNFNIAIRTMVIKNMIGTYCVGGGIVWDSIAEDEWNEAQLKSKILSKTQRGI